MKGHLFSSLISQSVVVMWPGRLPFHYHVCTNLQFNDLPFKPNFIFWFQLFASVLIHIFVMVKIKLLKEKQKKSYNVRTFSDHLKLGDISSMDNRSISDYLTSFVTVTAANLLFFTSFIINKTNPVEFTKVTFLHFTFHIQLRIQ